MSMTTIVYTPLKRELQDDEVLETQQSQGDLASIWNVWQYASKAAVAGTAVICVMAICGWVASSLFSWRFAPSKAPGLLPEGFFPDFGKVSIAFANGGDFTRNDSYGDQLWDQLVTVGAGYVRVPNPRQYDLPFSEPVKEDRAEYAEIFQASVVHQLHCMGILRNYTRAYENGLPPPKGAYMHVRHCIEYIRQAILCTANTTLEQANAGGAFTAEDTVHQCRDWTLAKAFLEDNRVDDFHPSILDT